MTSLREQVKYLQKRQVLDEDPEDDSYLAPNADSSSEEDEPPELDGREHYEAIGKSRLKKPVQPSLGKKYEGVTISRADLDNEDYDPLAPVDDGDDEDPFAPPSNNELRPDDDIPQLEKQKPKSLDSVEGISDHPKSGRDAVQNEEAESTSTPDLESSSDIDMDAVDEEDEDSTETSSIGSSERLDRRAQLRQLQRNDLQQVATRISSTQDIKQGQAVKRQQSTYDRLLDTRIKLQKGLTASHRLGSDSITDASAKEAIQKAEAAALSLWSTIDSLRRAMLPPDSKKRRLSLDRESVPSSELWAQSESLENSSRSRRRRVVDHWSRRTQASVPSQQRSKLSADSKEPLLTSVLDEYLNKEAAKSISSDVSQRPHDDGDQLSTNLHFSDDTFYQTLLRDLIASRTNNPLSTTLPSTTASLTSINGKPIPINNQKNRRGVDTKASKGRKLRYTAHEKLVNFMAPDDRTTWSESARIEFFRSLFGGQGGIRAFADEMDMDQDHRGSAGVEEGALRLFRS